MTTWTWALLPKGECWLRYDSSGDLHVLRADPRVTISDRLVEHVPEYEVWIAEWPD
jgi:hypothetical protein